MSKYKVLCVLMCSLFFLKNGDNYIESKINSREGGREYSIMKNSNLLKFTALFVFILATGLTDSFVGNATVALFPAYMVTVILAVFYLGIVAGLVSAVFAFLVMLLVGIQTDTAPTAFLMISVFSYFALLVAAVMFIDKYRSRASQLAEIVRKKDYDKVLAKEVHQSVFVPTPAENRFLSIGNKMIFTKELAGDYFYLSDLGEKVFYVIADISGKSVASALFTVILHENIITSLETSESLSEIIQNINSKIYLSLPEDMYITMFCCLIEPDSIKYVNAAHEPPLVFSQEQKKTYLLQNSDSLPVGISPFLELEENQLEFDSNDIFLAVSDGVTESDLFRENPYEKLTTLLHQTSDASAQRIADDIYYKAATDNPDFPLDDTIITCIKRKRKSDESD